MRRAKPIAAAVACSTAILLSACAASPGACSAGNASSLACLQARAQEPVFRSCLDDLFHEQSLSQKKRRAIGAQYGYPATNADTYFALRQMGVIMPSPREWCEEYAERRTALRIGNPT